MHHGKLEEEFLEIASDYSEGEEAEWRVGRALNWVFWAEEQLNQAITNMRELHSASKKISELGPLNIEEVIYCILEDGSDDQPAKHSMLIRRYKQARKQDFACGSKKKFSTNRAKGYLCKKTFATKKAGIKSEYYDLNDSEKKMFLNKLANTRFDKCTVASWNSNGIEFSIENVVVDARPILRNKPIFSFVDSTRKTVCLVPRPEDVRNLSIQCDIDETMPFLSTKISIKYDDKMIFLSSNDGLPLDEILEEESTTHDFSRGLVTNQ